MNNILKAGILIGGLTYGKFVINGQKCDIKKDLSGQNIIITGSSAGIGLETAKRMANCNANIVFACRNKEKTEQIINLIKKENENNEKLGKLIFMELDLNDLQSVVDFTKNYKQQFNKLDILVNNAGVYNLVPKISKQEIEQNFQVNYLSHFLLTQNLMDLITSTKNSRIINVSSRAHSRCPRIKEMTKYEDYNQFFLEDYKKSSYCKSKLCQVLYTKYLQKQFDESKNDVKVVSLHPGVIRTDIYGTVLNGLNMQEAWKYLQYVLKPFCWYFSKNCEQGAQTQIYCCLEDFNKLQGGKYYQDSKVVNSSQKADHLEDQKLLWEYSEQLINQKLNKQTI